MVLLVKRKETTRRAFKAYTGKTPLNEYRKETVLLYMLDTFKRKIQLYHIRSSNETKQEIEGNVSEKLRIVLLRSCKRLHKGPTLEVRANENER